MKHAMSNDVLKSARETLARAEGAARDAAAALAEAAGDQVETAHDYVARQARERPLATIGVAAGVGLLIGLLLNRGPRR